MQKSNAETQCRNEGKSVRFISFTHKIYACTRHSRKLDVRKECAEMEENMSSDEKMQVLNDLQEIQKLYFNESEKKWYKYLDQAIEELEYEKR